jgi:hypothetical protein
MPLIAHLDSSGKWVERWVGTLPREIRVPVPRKMPFDFTGREILDRTTPTHAVRVYKPFEKRGDVYVYA